MLKMLLMGTMNISKTFSYKAPYGVRPWWKASVKYGAKAIDWVRVNALSSGYYKWEDIRVELYNTSDVLIGTCGNNGWLNGSSYGIDTELVCKSTGKVDSVKLVAYNNKKYKIHETALSVQEITVGVYGKMVIRARVAKS